MNIGLGPRIRRPAADVSSIAEKSAVRRHGA
jgi:hypothetical protein